MQRIINQPEALVIRRIFQLCAEGVGQNRIARTLNAERAIAPRAQQGRPRAWAPTSVHEVLNRVAYRGLIRWNQTRKRNAWGKQQQTARPASDWLEVEAPSLRIVTEAEWAAAHRRLAKARAQYERETHGQRRPHRDRDSKYLLAGFARCALCGGGLHVRSRSHGHRRAFFYRCTSHHNRGPEVCSHFEQWPMEAIDQEVLAAIAGDVLRPAMIEDVVRAARQMFEASNRQDAHDQQRRELELLQREQGRLTDAIAAGGDVPILVERLKATEAKRRELAERLNAPRLSAPAWREIERRIRQSLGDWRSLFTGDDVAQARQGFRQLLTTPISFTPFNENGRHGVRFEGRIGLAALLRGEWATKLASPTDSDRQWSEKIEGIPFEGFQPERAA